MIRLQKYMASCGISSRREAEKMIMDGRVKVNGDIITEMGHKISKDDIVFVDGKKIDYIFEKKYYVLNKPRYFLSTVKDPKGRKTIMDLLDDEIKSYRVFPVGRLDYDTKGVLLLTNDGDFMNLLVGPSSHTEKEYLVRVKGIIKKEDLFRLQNGLKIKIKDEEYVTRKCKAYLSSVDRVNNSSLIGLIIEEGKYHQVKSMIKAIGYDVIRLSRIRFGVVSLDNLKEGQVRPLTIHEVKSLIGNAKSKSIKIQK